MLGIFFIILITYSLEFNQGKPYVLEPEINSDKLEFNLPDLNGNIINNDNEMFKEKVIFITIWGTWCPPCRSEIPTFIELQDRYKDDGLIILAIAFEKNVNLHDRRKYLAKFADEQQINYLILDGGDTSEFSNSLPQIDNVDGLPIEIFINRSGTVNEIRNGFGYSEEWAEELEEKLTHLLSFTD